MGAGAFAAFLAGVEGFVAATGAAFLVTTDALAGVTTTTTTTAAATPAVTATATTTETVVAETVAVVATPAATTLTPGEGVTYTVVSGDTLATIALAAYGDLNLYTDLCTFNTIANCDVIEIGDVINLPALDVLTAK